MLIVSVKEGEGVEKALKKLKKKFEKTGTLRELRRRQVFTKPSVARREVIKRARYKQHLIEAQELL
jgi:small subunit ribosomal protein S21